MKLSKLLLGLVLAGTTVGYAQDGGEATECDRLRLVGGKRIDVGNYKEAVLYYIKAEDECKNFEVKQYQILAGSVSYVIQEEQDAATKSAYIDTLLAVYDRAEAAGQYDTSWDLSRATYEAQSSKPNREKARKLFSEGIDREGVKVHESYVIMNGYNSYMALAEAPAEKRTEKKSQLITEYFKMMKLASDAKMSQGTIDNINYYFNLAVQSCNDILPDLGEFMKSFPQDAEQKKSVVNNYIALLESKGCTDSDEYAQLIDTLVVIDPSSFDANMAQAKLLESKKKYSAALTAYKNAKALTDDAEQLSEIDYAIARCYLGQGSYTAAYNAGMALTGKRKGDGYAIAAQAVAANANNCGLSTVDRKCNYYYAYDLAQKAAANGSSQGNGLAGKYKAKWPTDSELFNASLTKGSSVTLECYGVSVTIQ